MNNVNKLLRRVDIKYLEPLFLVFTLTLKLRVVYIRKKFKNLIFSKMAPKILIKFCGFILLGVSHKTGMPHCHSLHYTILITQHLPYKIWHIMS